jgi:hypothetical protein
MLLDTLKPFALLVSILALYGVFHAAFLLPATSVDERIRSGLMLLALAGCIAIASGMLFRESDGVKLSATLPVRLFLWTSAAMVMLFAVSWYVETFVVLYRDTRRY